jgi:hypothetical protein
MEHAAIIRFAPLFAALSLAACADPPLPRPELLNHPEAEWPQRTQQMSTRELYDVYRYYLSLKPPFDTSFSRYIGARGKAAVQLWVDDLDAGRKPKIDRTWTFGPLLQAALIHGNYDLCKDAPLYARATVTSVKRGIAQSGNSAMKLLNNDCETARVRKSSAQNANK